jgi:hypothetical protein
LAEANELLFLAMESVATKKGVELSEFDPLFLELLVPSAEIAGRGLSLGTGLSAFQDNLLTH